MKWIVSSFMSVCILISISWAADKNILADQKAKDSYSLGYEFGNNLKREEVELDLNVLLSAVRDALESKKSVLSADEIRANLQQLRKKTMVLQDRRARERAAKNLAEGEAFLAENKDKDRVKVLPSGLQYKIITDGQGATPKESDAVTVNYRGILINGTEIDSSSNRSEPTNVHVNGVMKGWTEALQLMKPGSKWQLFVPAKLAYGERPFGRIPANSVLIFELELVGINKESSSTVAGMPQHRDN